MFSNIGYGNLAKARSLVAKKNINIKIIIQNCFLEILLNFNFAPLQSACAHAPACTLFAHVFITLATFAREAQHMVLLAHRVVVYEAQVGPVVCWLYHNNPM